MSRETEKSLSSGEHPKKKKKYLYLDKFEKHVTEDALEKKLIHGEVDKIYIHLTILWAAIAVIVGGIIWFGS